MANHREFFYRGSKIRIRKENGGFFNFTILDPGEGVVVPDDLQNVPNRFYSEEEAEKAATALQDEIVDRHRSKKK